MSGVYCGRCQDIDEKKKACKKHNCKLTYEKYKSRSISGILFEKCQDCRDGKPGQLRLGDEAYAEG